MLTTAVFSIVLTAPLGAIMINTLGTKWLEYDGDDEELKAKQGIITPSKEDDESQGQGDTSNKKIESQG